MVPNGHSISISSLLFSATRNSGYNLHRIWKSVFSQKQTNKKTNTKKQSCSKELCHLTFAIGFSRYPCHQDTSIFTEKTANISVREINALYSPKLKLKKWEKLIRTVLCLSHIPCSYCSIKWQREKKSLIFCFMSEQSQSGLTLNTEKSKQPFPEKEEMLLPRIGHEKMNRRNLSQRCRAERNGKCERKVLS